MAQGIQVCSAATNDLETLGHAARREMALLRGTIRQNFVRQSHGQLIQLQKTSSQT